MSAPEPITIDDIRAAATRCAGRVHRTPIVTCRAIDAAARCTVFLKCENFQKVGAFKIRGATNAVVQLEEDAAARGVVTHSSGNHAQALALAARERGIPAVIVMPENAPAVKRRAVEGYGARIVSCSPTLEARESTARAVLAETGGAFVHPYNDPRIIAGQGTCGLEILEDIPDLDAIVAPIGGGGLMSGTALVAHALSPRLRVIGAEPAGADDAARSLAAGRLIPQTGPDTIADGLLTSLGSLTWPIVKTYVERILTVQDETIVSAMRMLFERAKLVVEPSGAVALAAVLSTEFPPDVRRVAVILSGGNVDLDRLPW